MSKEVEYHDDCPKCKKEMKRVDKDNKKSLFYYCKNCKQKYRVYTPYKTQIIDCPHCNKKIRLTKKNIDDLHMNNLLNFDVRKQKV